MNELDKILEAIRESLSDDLLDSTRRKKISKERKTRQVSKDRGHCYVATEALYWLYGKDLGYKPQFAVCAGGGTHWWLRNPDTLIVLDPTAEQTGYAFDYDQGRYGNFRIKVPSKRCQKLMARAVCEMALRALYAALYLR